MEPFLKGAVKGKYDIIICACRSYGGTTKAIKDICKNYEKIWISKNKLNSDTELKSDIGNKDKLNNLANENCAQSIQNILKTLI